MPLIDIYDLRDRLAHARSLALVGSAPTILAWNHGELIDSYDLVVRFNRAYTQGLEAQIGSRTDILVANELMSLNRSPSPAPLLKPTCVLGFFIPKQGYNLQPFKDWVGDLPYVITLAPDLYTYGMHQRTHSFTIGTYALYTLQKLFDLKEVFITGFTLCGEVSGGSETYYDPENLNFYHPVDVEAKIFSKMVKDFSGQVQVTEEVRRVITKTFPFFGRSLQSVGTGSSINATRGGPSRSRRIFRKLCSRVSRQMLNGGYRLRRIAET